MLTDLDRDPDLFPERVDHKDRRLSSSGGDDYWVGTVRVLSIFFQFL
jgi:hypothetical protein